MFNLSNLKNIIFGLSKKEPTDKEKAKELKEIFLSNSFQEYVESFYKLISFQANLVLSKLKENKKTYRNKGNELLLILKDDWVFGYICGLSLSYLKETPEWKKKYHHDVLRDYFSIKVLSKLDFHNQNDEKYYSNLYHTIYFQEERIKQDTSFFRGFLAGDYDYSNLLKNGYHKKLPCMGLCHHLCRTLEVPLIEENKESSYESYHVKEQKLKNKPEFPTVPDLPFTLPMKPIMTEKKLSLIGLEFGLYLNWVEDTTKKSIMGEELERRITKFLQIEKKEGHIEGFNDGDIAMINIHALSGEISTMQKTNTEYDLDSRWKKMEDYYGFL